MTTMTTMTTMLETTWHVSIHLITTYI